MERALRLLIIEDSEDDAMLTVRELRRGGFAPSFQRIETAEELEAALAAGPWDVAIIDYSLPRFTGLDALRIMLERGLDIPFMIVSGTIGEEKAAEAMKAGAHDCIMKGNFARLLPALDRELKEAAVRRERREAEKALRENERSLTRVLESIQDGIVIIDREQRIVMANPTEERWHPEKLPLVGRHCHETLFCGSFPDEECPGRKTLMGGRSSFAMVPFQGEDGTEQWREIYTFPISGNGDGRTTGVVEYVRDITRRKRAEEELLQLNAELEQRVAERTALVERANIELNTMNLSLQLQQWETEQAKFQAEAANRAKSDFLANMSHELRTPLNSVLGFSEVLEDELYGPLNEKQKEFVANIHASGEHLLGLISDILDLAKVESGKIELETSSFLLQKVLAQSLTMLKEKALRHEVDMLLEIDPSANIEIEADERKLKQVLFNLLSNAVKFTPDRGSVRVVAKRKRIEPHDWIEIAVEDTGIGILQEDLPKLFHPFTQLESSYTRTREGTGLGLALTRKLVELHGGNIRVESVFGRGSRFIFEIPVSQHRSDPSQNLRSHRAL